MTSGYISVTLIFGPPGVPSMQNKGKCLKKREEGGHLLGRSFRAPSGGGQLFGHGYASGHESLIMGFKIFVSSHQTIFF